MAKKNIKHLAEDDRPREKVLGKGHSALSDAELLAIILGSGNQEENAVELAQNILESCGRSWDKLARLSIKQLCKFNGVGPVKAISVLTALEIAKRKSMEQVKDRPLVKSSKDSFELMAPYLMDLNTEEFWVAFLNKSLRVLHIEQATKGGINQTVVDPRIIFKKAFEWNATALLLAHNHPSGSLKASDADKNITKKIYEGGKLLDIELLDHLIIGDKNYYSFADHGLIGI